MRISFQKLPLCKRVVLPVARSKPQVQRFPATATSTVTIMLAPQPVPFETDMLSLKRMHESMKTYLETFNHSHGPKQKTLIALAL